MLVLHMDGTLWLRFGIKTHDMLKSNISTVKATWPRLSQNMSKQHMLLRGTTCPLQGSLLRFFPVSAAYCSSITMAVHTVAGRHISYVLSPF